MDVFERRAILQGHDNPGGRTDYIAAMQGRLTFDASGGVVSVTVRYVPDRHVLTPESFDAYLTTIERLEWASLEEVALAIVKDISNEMLTRWTQVNAKSAGDDGSAVGKHEVTVEDRQPGWRNDDLLYRLAPL